MIYETYMIYIIFISMRLSPPRSWRPSSGCGSPRSSAASGPITIMIFTIATTITIEHYLPLL